MILAIVLVTTLFASGALCQDHADKTIGESRSQSRAIYDQNFPHLMMHYGKRWHQQPPMRLPEIFDPYAPQRIYAPGSFEQQQQARNVLPYILSVMLEQKQSGNSREQNSAVDEARKTSYSLISPDSGGTARSAAVRQPQMLRLITDEAAIDAEDDESISAKAAAEDSSAKPAAINVTTRSMRNPANLIPKEYISSLLYGRQGFPSRHQSAFGTFNKKAEPQGRRENLFMHFGR